MIKLVYNDESNLYDPVLYLQDARTQIQYGEYDLAIVTLFNILNIKNTPEQRITAHKLLCQCYRKTEQYSLALVHINKAISIISSNQFDNRSREEYAICLMNKGVVFEVQEKFTNAISCYQSALAIFLKLFENRQESHGIIINALLTLGACYEKKGSIELALETYKECLGYFHEDAGNDRRYYALINTIHDLEEKYKERTQCKNGL